MDRLAEGLTTAIGPGPHNLTSQILSPLCLVSPTALGAAGAATSRKRFTSITRPVRHLLDSEGPRPQTFKPPSSWRNPYLPFR